MTWLDSDAWVPSQTSDGGGTLTTEPPGGWDLSLSPGTAAQVVLKAPWD